MTPIVYWRGALIGLVVLSVSGGLSWSQQSSTKQRDDPATSGAGPTSGAPGQYNYDPPRGGSVTTDARGVTTVQPSQAVPKTDNPGDRGIESVGTPAPK
jgi:hypothetical protein